MTALTFIVILVLTSINGQKHAKELEQKEKDKTEQSQTLEEKQNE